MKIDRVISSVDDRPLIRWLEAISMAIKSTDQNIDMFRFKISEIQYSISSTVSRINKKLLKKFDSDRIKKSDAIKERIDKSMESLKSDLEELKKLALFAED